MSYVVFEIGELSQPQLHVSDQVIESNICTTLTTLT